AMIAVVSSAAARLASAQKTFAPSRAKATAVALPLPQPGPIDPAPTTSATLPLSRSGMLALAPRVVLAQFGLQDLSVIVLRQRFDEDVILRPLESCDLRQTKLVELGGTRLADDISDDDFAPFRVRPADHGGFAHLAVGEQHLLDFARIDVGAAGNDE